MNTNTNNTYPITAELFNLLTLPYADDVENYTVEDILKLITAAAESVQRA